MQVFKDYIDISRLNKPIGIWLLLFPGYMGLSFFPVGQKLSLFFIFAVGAWAMRGAGCIYNDIIDRKFDGKVKRTQSRPLVRKNKPLSLKVALAFLLVHLLVGLVCLLMLSFKTVCVGFFAAVLIFAYPWMKRITYWPQLFLGFTMNMGFVMGAVEASGFFSVSAIIFYAGLVLWTLGYDTIYGFQDMDDDAVIGVRSSTFKVKLRARLFIFGCYAAAVLLWVFSGWVSMFGQAYFVAVVCTAALLLWQALGLNYKNSHNCLLRFKSNQWVGFLLWCAVILWPIV